LLQVSVSVPVLELQMVYETAVKTQVWRQDQVHLQSRPHCQVGEVVLAVAAVFRLFLLFLPPLVLHDCLLIEH
jgi:hypothetical protein